jgi:TonB-dependent receptor
LVRRLVPFHLVLQPFELEKCLTIKQLVRTCATRFKITFVGNYIDSYREEEGGIMRAVRIGCLLILASWSVGAGHVGAQGKGKIIGTVSDSTNRETLPSANISVEGTSVGATSDLDGRYWISNVPSGKQVVVASYIGYETKRVEVLVHPGSALDLDIEMQMRVLEGDEIVVTAQLQGQAAAINQQIASNTIVNVVSAEKIRELPDQNAAESVGRLPGVSVQREAGEGTKVVVRGLSPKFNSITVNGERIPSTDAEDRSVDLSMISPDALAGIEVFKALTPDKDGDAIGGTVNLVMRRAPSELQTNFRGQTGYNEHEGELGQFTGSFGISNRFGDDEELGAIFTGNFQRADRSSDQLNAGYSFVREAREGEERAVVGVNNLNLVDRLETRNRFGATLTLDRELKSGSILFNSFWSETRRDELRRRKRYRLGAARTEYEIRDRRVNTRLLTAALSGKHTLKRLVAEWRGSLSKASQEIPFSHTGTFRELAAFNSDVDENSGPDAIPAGAKSRVDATFFKDANYDSLDVDDRDFTTQLDLKLPFNFGTVVSGYLKAGLKYRNKKRTRDITRWRTNSFGINSIGEANPDLFDLDREQRVLISNYIIPGSDVAKDFLEGRFNFGPIIDPVGVKQFGVDFRDHYSIAPEIELEDYEAGEKIFSQFVMAEINLGKRLLFIPGIRFERTRTNYKSIFGSPATVQLGGSGLLGVIDTTGGKSYLEALPMVHIRFRLTDWFDVRLAATESLSRPNYFNLVPWERISPGESTVELGNPDLKHTSAYNYDAFLSFYGNRGLFTVGGFYKRLDRIDYLRTTRNQEPGRTFGYSLTSPVNSEEETTVKGYEIELQTNLKTLPSPWDGVVLHFNYSHIISKTFYPLFLIGPRSPNPPFRPTLIDTVRQGRMPNQADDIANLSIGYEKRGFSARYSLIYQGKALQNVGTRIELDGFTDTFLRQDLALQQKVTGNASLFVNANNLSNVSEGAFLGSRQFATEEEFFGWTADIGIRYEF